MEAVAVALIVLTMVGIGYAAREDGRSAHSEPGVPNLIDPPSLG